MSDRTKTYTSLCYVVFMIASNLDMRADSLSMPVASIYERYFVIPIWDATRSTSGRQGNGWTHTLRCSC